MIFRVSATLAVWRHGYRWVMRRESGELETLSPPLSADAKPRAIWLAMVQPSPEEVRANLAVGREPFRAYRPMEESPELFLLFSELEPTPEAILAFANKYACPVGPDDWLGTLADWQSGISEMKRAVALWEAVETEKGRALALAREQLDEMLAALVVNIRAHFTGERTKAGALDLWLTVKTLGEVLWVQFLAALLERRQFGRCAWCGRPFPIAQERIGRRRVRSDRVFCTDACRVKQYLRRRKTAVEMRAGGARLSDIAREVQTDVKTIKQWIEMEGGEV